MTSKSISNRNSHMRGSAFLVAVSAVALLAGCNKSADHLGMAKIAPQATSVASAAPVSAATPLLDMAREALARGDAAAAAPFAARVLDTDPTNVDAMRLVAESTLMLGDPIKAEGLFRQVVSAEPKSASAKAGLGLALLSQQRGVEAQSYLREAANLKPPVAVLSNIAFALTLAGAPDEAVALLEPFVANPESTPKLRQNLAFALVAANKRARAFEVAGYDLDGIAAARQVAVWSDAVRLPMAAQVTQLAGLKVVDAPAYAAVAPVVAAPVALAAAKPAPNIAPVAAVDIPVQKPVDLADNSVRASDIVVTSQVSLPVSSVASDEPASVAPQIKPLPVSASAAPASAKTQLAKVKVLAPAAKMPAVQTASFAMPTAVAVPKAAVAAIKAVQRLEGWMVQVAAVRIHSASAITKVQRQYHLLFGKTTPIQFVSVGNADPELKRIFIGKPQSRTAATGACAKLRAKGTACLVRDMSKLSLAAPAPVAKPAAAPAVTTAPAATKPRPSKVVKI